MLNWIKNIEYFGSK